MIIFHNHFITKKEYASEFVMYLSCIQLIWIAALGKVGPPSSYTDQNLRSVSTVLHRPPPTYADLHRFHSKDVFASIYSIIG